jgi:hypothetical protein
LEAIKCSTFVNAIFIAVILHWGEKTRVKCMKHHFDELALDENFTVVEFVKELVTAYARKHSFSIDQLLMTSSQLCDPFPLKIFTKNIDCLFRELLTGIKDNSDSYLGLHNSAFSKSILIPHKLAVILYARWLCRFVTMTEDLPIMSSFLIDDLLFFRLRGEILALTSDRISPRNFSNLTPLCASCC